MGWVRLLLLVAAGPVLGRRAAVALVVIRESVGVLVALVIRQKAVRVEVVVVRLGRLEHVVHVGVAQIVVARGRT